MLGQSDGHRWCVPLVASPGHGTTRLAKRRVRSQPVMLEERQAEQRVPRRGALGESVRLARQARQPVSKHPVEPLDVNRHRLLLHLRSSSADSSADLNAQQLPVLVAVFDGLR